MSGRDFLSLVCLLGVSALPLGCGDDTNTALGAPDSGSSVVDGSAPNAPDAAHDSGVSTGDAGDPSDGGDANDGGERRQDSGTPGPQKKCVVFLHGKSGGGFGTSQQGNYFLVGPTGNAEGWGGRQWIYFPDAKLAEVRKIIADAIADDGCTRVIIHGFSNGAAAAAKLYCRGDDFGDKVVGYIIDDPVPDHGADTCTPATGVKARLYWTGGLAPADGWNCAEGDWTCEGGTTVGIAKFADSLGLQATQSAKTGHEPYGNPPEYQSWW